MLQAELNVMVEWSYTSSTAYDDPFNDVELDVVVTTPDGTEHVVPAFWAGDTTWRVRYAATQLGRHRFTTRCSDPQNDRLHGVEGVLDVQPYDGTNALLQHGPLRISPDRRHFEHHDGTPFFWLADTWWMGLCKRLAWPDEFAELTADRVAKHFSVVQIVAGLYPDMPPFDERGANEGGFPWQADFGRVNPLYWDHADRRIAHMVEAGIVPCIVGSWGYFIDFAGQDVLRKHWRYLVARYSAYPVVWCAAGEALLPYYLSQHFPAPSAAYLDSLRTQWSGMIEAIRALDPQEHPITIHPTRYGHDQVDDRNVLDFDMLQTGHGGYHSLAPTIDMLSESLALEPPMPVLVAEVNYEGILESSREEIQRFLFWSCLLSGAAGHTYGANGLWQLNGSEPYGPSPHGTAWGNLPWREAAHLPGSAQLGIGKQLLERLAWWQLKPQPEWIEPHQESGKRMSPYAAGDPGGTRIFYVPAEAIWIMWQGNMLLTQLDAAAYNLIFFDPKTGSQYDHGTIKGDTGSYRLPKPPIFQDWVLLLTPID